ncbi:MAG: serine hydrolase [Flavobacterium sp.]|uniref:serine hydrolase domain-containing protein n=1 Tax=Flavobacterium sp. TaxID=239 RepID=UPI0026387C6E|nr:serine hydrolase domain-containing protein [Flavobacterium sp.]MDD5152301.1 serine hydrolase [Flavobacterium sp.]
MKLQKYFFLNLTILLLLFSCESSKKLTEIKKNEITTEIDKICLENKFNGSVLLTKNNKNIYSKTFGYSDISEKTILNKNNQFVIGSISKQITAVLILKEYEKGKLKFEDKISNYLPEIKQSWADDVTIHQLLTHTHGIVDIENPLEFEQGSQFHYSQLGFELLSKILEKITNKTFEQLSTEFFVQNGLKNTFHPNNKTYKNLVKGYEENENGLLEYVDNSLINYVPAGSFISNCEDLNKWNEMLHSNKLVKKTTLKLMSTKYATRIHPIFETVEYGYGLLFKDGESEIQIGALGYAPGFASASYYYPKTKMNLVILENTAYSPNNIKNTFKPHIELMNLVKKTNAQ